MEEPDIDPQRLTSRKASLVRRRCSHLQGIKDSPQILKGC
jgi:hypothetical protein